jgi:transposase
MANGMGFAMSAPIKLREDYDGEAMRRLAKQSADAGQVRRLLALAAIYDGGQRRDAAEIGGVGLQTVRDWVLAFNAEGPAGLATRKHPGPARLLSEAQWQELARIVEEGPKPYLDGVVRWRLLDLTGWVYESFGISISEPTMSRTLRGLGYRKLSARPRHHDQKPESLVDFKKNSQPSSGRSQQSRRQASR